MSFSNVVSLAKDTFKEWSQDKASRLAAALAFYAMLSIAPLLVVALTILTVAYGDKAQQKVNDSAGSFVSGEAATAVNQLIGVAASKKTNGIRAAVIGFVIALVSASGLFGNLQEAMNTIWGVQPDPKAGWLAMVRARAVSAGMVGVAAAFLLGSLVASTVLSAVVKHLGPLATTLSFVAEIVVSLGLLTALFAMIFRFLPDVEIAWRDVWLGAGITAALFVIGKYGLTLYFKFAAVGSPFGAAGSLAALLVWVYYSAQILFFGAEFTQVYAASKGKPIQPNHYAVKLTAADRANQGMPTDEEVRAAAAAKVKGSAGKSPKPAAQAAAARAKAAGGGRSAIAGARALLAAPRSGGDGKAGAAGKGKDYALAAGGAALGALVGGLAVEYLLHDPKKPARKHLAAVRLDERLGHIEDRVGHVSRLKNTLEDLHVRHRIDDVARQVRRATTTLKSEQTGRPKWMVRLGQMLVGA